MSHHHVRYDLIIDILRGLGAVRQAQANHLAQQTRAYHISAESRIRELEIDADRERSQRQSAILEKLIDAQTLIANRRIDLLVEAFRATHSLLAEQQRALLKEKTVVTREKSETPRDNTQKYQFLRMREVEISDELEKIRNAHLTLQGQVQIFSLQYDIPILLPNIGI